jgi:hypothetical protein
MKNFLLITILAFTSCSTLLRTGGALVGGGAGALAGPPGIAVGVGAGIAAVDLYLQEDEIQEKEEQIKALTMGDIHSVVNTAEKGIIGQIYDLGILVIIGISLFFLGSFLYTLKRRNKGEAFYSRIKKLEAYIDGSLKKL